MVRHPQQRAHPGRDLIRIPPFHIRCEAVKIVRRCGPRKQIQTGDCKQSDADHGLAAKVLLHSENILQKQWDGRSQSDAAPEDARVKTAFRAQSEQSHRQCAHNIPVVEITKNRRFAQTVKGVPRRYSVARSRLHHRNAHRIIKGNVVNIKTMPYLQIGQRKLHHNKPGQCHAKQYPRAAPNPGEERSMRR